ncbi:Cysteine--tRNA ligase [compost metagenome]
MSDDFNTPIAIAELFEGVRIINSVKAGSETITAEDLETLTQLFNDFLFDIFGLQKEEHGSNNVGKVLDLLIDMRNNAKANKDYATSDTIRNKLLEIGYQLKDSKDGTTWSAL